VEDAARRSDSTSPQALNTLTQQEFSAGQSCLKQVNSPELRGVSPENPELRGVSPENPELQGNLARVA
jgi:hypothetical protein